MDTFKKILYAIFKLLMLCSALVVILQVLIICSVIYLAIAYPSTYKADSELIETFNSKPQVFQKLSMELCLNKVKTISQDKLESYLSTEISNKNLEFYLNLMDSIDVVQININNTCSMKFKVWQSKKYIDSKGYSYKPKKIINIVEDIDKELENKSTSSKPYFQRKLNEDWFLYLDQPSTEKK
ncbi:MAG: hypothetical protein COB02_06920 [Candidatus Cloacimonadota bacterium]|nr:MAG: hypothetical protein COB02_06920 [Candidatus Cloacimonadota bacterium]